MGDNADVALPQGMSAGVFEQARVPDRDMDREEGRERDNQGRTQELPSSPPSSAGEIRQAEQADRVAVIRGSRSSFDRAGQSSISSHPTSGFTHPTRESMSTTPSLSSHKHASSGSERYNQSVPHGAGQPGPQSGQRGKDGYQTDEGDRPGSQIPSDQQGGMEELHLNGQSYGNHAGRAAPQVRPTHTRPRQSSNMSSFSSMPGASTSAGGSISGSSFSSHNHNYAAFPASRAGGMVLPPDQQSMSDTASTLSMSVRVPGRIPSSTERKSSLPPPISPRTASLSQQQPQPYTYGGAFNAEASGSGSTLHAGPSGESSRSRVASGSSSANGHHATSAPAGRSKQSRVPSRHLLQSALDLAQQAVQMDQNNDVAGALAAYREAVSRLKAVMARVAADAERDGKRRRSGKAEEEGRTLQGIHDAYVARIQLLSSYETQDQPGTMLPLSPSIGTGLMPSPRLGEAGPNSHAGASTATLVPSRTPRAPGQGLQDTSGASIGAMMLGAPVGESSSPRIVEPELSSSHPSAPPFGLAGTRPPTEPERTDRSGSGNSLGLGLPSSPSKRMRNGRPDTAGSGASTPSRQHRFRNQSMGLEDEAGLTEADGLVDYPAEAEEETLAPSPVVPSSSISPSKSSKSKGHHARTSSLSRIGQLISSSTSHGTISQRRNKASSPRISIDSKGDSESGSGLPSSKSLARPLGRHREPERVDVTPGRSRSVSQPGGRRGEYQAEMGDNVPPLPNVRKKTSFGNMAASSGYRAGSMRSDSLAPPVQSQTAHRSPSHSSLMRSDTGSMMSRRSHGARSGSAHGSLMSPVPPAQPTEVLHRPFHVLRVLRSSMDADGPGAYLTGAIHIPSAVWNPSAYTKEGTGSRLPGPRIVAQDVKVRVIDQMLLHLEIIRHTGALLLEGPREVNFAVAGVAAPRVGSKKCMDTGDEFVKVLEAFEEEMDGVHRSLVKGGVALDAWKGKKGSNAMSWSSKMARSMDKMSGSSKGLETPDRYVDILAAFCSALQTLDDHLCNFTGPCTPAYHALSEATYRQLEVRMLRAADFVKVVVAPFVLDDFKQFFHRYLKAGMLYIEN